MNATNPLESSESDNIVFVDAEESEESFMNNSFFKKDRKFLNDFENLEVDDFKCAREKEEQSLSIEEVISKCCPDLSNSSRKGSNNDLNKSIQRVQDNPSSYISNNKLKTKDQFSNTSTNHISQQASINESKKCNNSNHNSQLYNKPCQYNSQPLYPNTNNYYYQMPYGISPYVNKASHFQPQFYQNSALPIYPQSIPINHINYQYGVVLSPANSRIRPPNQQIYYSNSFSNSKKPKFPSSDSSQEEDFISQPQNKSTAKTNNSSKIVKENDEQLNNENVQNQNQLTIKAILNRGNVAEYINSQKGSKKLQFLFETMEDHDPEIILLFDHITPFLGKISNHNFGNYFCQVLLKKIPFHKRQVAWKFYGRRNLMDYASHQFGNHSIQSLIDAVNSLAEENFVISQLEKHYDNLAFNINGCYILLRVMSQFQLESCKSLINYIKINFHSISCNGTATSIARKFVKIIAGSIQANLRAEFLISIQEKSFSQLFNDKHGSQVIILILNEWDNKSTQKIIDIVAKKIIHNMMGRFSRNIVLKCLQTTLYKVNFTIYYTLNNLDEIRNWHPNKSRRAWITRASHF